MEGVRLVGDSLERRVASNWVTWWWEWVKNIIKGRSDRPGRVEVPPGPPLQNGRSRWNSPRWTAQVAFLERPPSGVHLAKKSYRTCPKHWFAKDYERQTQWYDLSIWVALLMCELCSFSLLCLRSLVCAIFQRPMSLCFKLFTFIHSTPSSYFSLQYSHSITSWKPRLQYRINVYGDN